MKKGIVLVIPFLLLVWPCSSLLLEEEYVALYENAEDKDGLDAIRSLHKQLDNDNDGAIEPFETGEFIRGDLQSSDPNKRQNIFHSKDSEVTVKDLWDTWKKSAVHNWTTDQTVDWLINSLGLSQYEKQFRLHALDGSKIPQLAVNSAWLSKVVGVRNPIHRSKIALKAMDVVLFGPPKDPNNFIKDVVFTIIIFFAISGLFYTYQQNRKAQDNLKKMMEDMDKLGVAEKNLLDLQTKLNQKEAKRKSTQMIAPLAGSGEDTGELKRMKEEIEVLRSQLYAAETELEDKCWCCPPVLQTWLQICYEIESQNFSIKKKLAEEQLELAKDMCDKLKKKRSSLVGAFVSTHGHSINEIDKMILDARSSLLEVTKDLSERTHRWKQIEMLCGISIVNNPGLSVLHKQVRTVGYGRSRMGINTRASIEDYDDSDSHSVAASMASGITTSSRTSVLRSRFVKPPLSRDSSKESASTSTSSDEREVEVFKVPKKEISPVTKPASFDSGMGSNASVVSEISPTTVTAEESGVTITSSSIPLSRIVPSASTPANLNISIDGSCSDSGSLNDLDKKEKKKKSFFAFKKKLKDKKDNIP